MGIRMLPPDVNSGYPQFTVCDGNIRFGIAAIKSVGKAAVEEMVRDREKNGEYISLTHFLERMSSKVNTKCVESLILSGAFDSLGGKRSQYFRVHKQIHNGLGQSRRNNIEGQMNLFAMTADKPEDLYRDSLPDIPEFTQWEMLSMEKELTGIYISGHPLAEYESVLKRFVSCTTLDFPQNDDEIDTEGKLHDKERVVIGGIIEALSVKYTKRNQKMAYVTLEDMNGSVDVIVFPQLYDTSGELLGENNVILVTGRTDISEGNNPKVIAESIRSYSELSDAQKTVWVKLPADKGIGVEAVKTILAKNRGSSKVIIYDEKTKKRLTAPVAYYVKPSEELTAALTELCGEGCVVVK
jgi:DNA polymerase-3 subunit alpha